MSAALLQFILGGGLVALVGSVAQGSRMLLATRRSARQREMASLENWRQRALDEADYYRNVAGIWSARAGTLEFELVRLGGTPPPMPTIPPRPIWEERQANDPTPR